MALLKMHASLHCHRSKMGCRMNSIDGTLQQLYHRHGNTVQAVSAFPHVVDVTIVTRSELKAETTKLINVTMYNY